MHTSHTMMITVGNILWLHRVGCKMYAVRVGKSKHITCVITTSLQRLCESKENHMNLIWSHCLCCPAKETIYSGLCTNHQCVMINQLQKKNPRLDVSCVEWPSLALKKKFWGSKCR